MLEPVREYFVKDGVAMQTWQYDTSWSRNRKTVYDVLRVSNGTPLFVDEHIDRLIKSAYSAGMAGIIDAKKVKASIDRLIEANTQDDGNILCCIIKYKRGFHILAWYVKHRYPTEEEYSQGVFVRTLKAIRKNPGTKIWNSELRRKAEYIIESSEAYEVLLVDRKKKITEGSRSNVFFIRGDVVYTPPEDKVLKGITRQKVIEICNKMQIPVTKNEIPLNELAFYEGAFITGTSPGVLPILKIDDLRFNTSNAIIKKLMAAYNKLTGEATISP